MLRLNPKRQAERARQVAERRIAEKAARRGALMAVQGRAASMGPADLAPAPKAETLEHEGYRRLVALLPCKNCGVGSYSQAAHPNTGKGMGAKTDDRLCFPLCCDRPGVRGCHPQFDQAALFPKHVRRALEPAWARDTQRQIISLGLWPKDLPVPESEP
jgi:hypothetical protein